MIDETDDRGTQVGMNSSTISEVLPQNKTYVKMVAADGSYVCDLCGEEQCDAINLRLHKNQHLKDRNFPCLQCDKTFPTHSRLNRHKKRHSDHKPFKCAQCGKGFKEKGHLTTHMTTHSDDKPFSCSFCSKPFAHKISLRRHEARHIEISENLQLPCPLCDRVFSRQKTLTSHLKLHSGERPHLCRICAKSFALKELLMKHERTHFTTTRDHECNMCGKTYTQSDYLKRHMRLVHFYCFVCKSSCESKAERNRHRIRHRENFQTVEAERTQSELFFLGDTSESQIVEAENGTSATEDDANDNPQEITTFENNDEDLADSSKNVISETIEPSPPPSEPKMYACEACDMTFTHNYKLNEHFLMHTGGLVCDICNMSFSTKQTLKRHMVRHSHAQELKCEQCNKSFSYIKSLQAHMKAHEDKENGTFKCDQCERTFAFEFLLTKHMRSHDHKCEVCNREFRSGKDLNRHKLVHTRERPFKCDVCQATYRQKKDLKAHARTHTGEMPYKCDQCDKRFNYTSSLDKHRKNHTRSCNYLCNVCSKMFTTEAQIVKHQEVHTERFVMLYSCIICEESFSKRKEFDRHASSHLDKVTLACGKCGSTFKRQLNLDKHVAACTGQKKKKKSKAGKVLGDFIDCQIGQEDFKDSSGSMMTVSSNNNINNNKDLTFNKQEVGSVVDVMEGVVVEDVKSVVVKEEEGEGEHEDTTEDTKTVSITDVVQDNIDELMLESSADTTDECDLNDESVNAHVKQEIVVPGEVTGSRTANYTDTSCTFTENGENEQYSVKLESYEYDNIVKVEQLDI